MRIEVILRGRMGHKLKTQICIKRKHGQKHLSQPSHHKLKPESPHRTMASTQTNIPPTPAPSPGAPPATGSLLVSLVPLAPDALETMLANLAPPFPTRSVLVATPPAAPQ